jgi:hypothetical protein
MLYSDKAEQNMHLGVNIYYIYMYRVVDVEHRRGHLHEPPDITLVRLSTDRVWLTWRSKKNGQTERQYLYFLVYVPMVDRYAPH